MYFLPSIFYLPCQTRSVPSALQSSNYPFDFEITSETIDVEETQAVFQN